MALSRTWTIRRYEYDDDARISELLNLCIQNWPGSNYWDWIHKKNPLGFHGSDGDIWVAETNNGDLVGYYSITRFPMRYYGGACIGSQSLQTATHPNFRRQGIFDTLLSSCLEDAKKNGVKFIFGFPNRYSYQGFMKKNWIDHGISTNFHCILNRKKFVNSRYNGFAMRAISGAILRLLRAHPRQPKPWQEENSGDARNIEIIEGGDFSSDIGTVWDSVKHKYNLGIERTREYLKWRYNSIWANYQVLTATRRAESVGYAVYRTVESKGVKAISICELIGKNHEKEVYERLLHEVLTRAYQEDSDIGFIIASAGRQTGYDGIINKKGFRNFERIIGAFRGLPSSHRILYPVDPKDRDSLTHATWYYSPGDCDAG
jgi:GNAT superfamily N-acetyltransferase